VVAVGASQGEATASTVPDVKMTTPIHRELARRNLLPAEHYVDSGYPCAEVLDQAHRQFGLTLVTPALLDTSRQARAGDGFDKTARGRTATLRAPHPPTTRRPGRGP
jgi:hypothetical protein